MICRCVPLHPSLTVPDLWSCAVMCWRPGRGRGGRWGGGFGLLRVVPVGPWAAGREGTAHRDIEPTRSTDQLSRRETR
jgi:hypothetical protein